MPKKKPKTPEKTESSHRVTLFRDTLHQFPELYLEVFINGPDWEERAFAEMFVRGRCTRADSPEKADLVVFVGGADVDPLLYGQTPHPNTHCDPELDKRDLAVYKICYDNGIPMLGVCRGAQFLHVMNGGKLYQHVDAHNSEHNMWDKRRTQMIAKVSSVHHQMVVPNAAGGMVVLADTFKSSKRWLNAKEYNEGHRPDIEAFFYPETCCIGIQGHPEYKGYSQFTKWSLERIHEFVNENPDVVLRDGFRRLKEDIIDLRKSPLDTDKILKELC